MPAVRTPSSSWVSDPANAASSPASTAASRAASSSLSRSSAWSATSYCPSPRTRMITLRVLARLRGGVLPLRLRVHDLARVRSGLDGLRLLRRGDALEPGQLPLDLRLRAHRL